MSRTGNTSKAAKGNGAAEAAAEGKTAPANKTAAPQVSPEMRGKLAELRERIQLHVGQAVLAMMNLPRYRSQTLGDLAHLVIEPLLRDRLAIASARKKDADEGASDQGGATAGIAIWASVSDEVDAKIREQIESGVFPLRLGAEDWASGETVWLLDVIAPNPHLATAVLANFKQVSGDKRVSVHPIVARSVDPETLERMKTASGR